jgi:hypothetical protein
MTRNLLIVVLMLVVLALAATGWTMDAVRALGRGGVDE